MNDSYIGQLHDPAPGELDLADPLHAFHALVWRRQAKRCWRERLAFLGRARETKLACEVPDERGPCAERDVGLTTFRHLDDLTVEPGDFRARIERANRADGARAT